MADADLQIRAGGGKGADHPDPETRGGGGLQKTVFRPFGPHFGRKVSGGGGEAGLPGPSPGSATAKTPVSN